MSSYSANYFELLLQICLVIRHMGCHMIRHCHRPFCSPVVEKALLQYTDTLVNVRIKISVLDKEEFKRCISNSNHF